MFDSGCAYFPIFNVVDCEQKFFFIISVITRLIEDNLFQMGIHYGAFYFLHASFDCMTDRIRQRFIP